MCNYWITKEELLILAETNGYKGIASKFDRWRKADLLPRPRRICRPGKSTTFFAYPPETRNQLIALCRLHFGHGPERRFDPLRLALWCEGFQIPLSALKRTLKKLFVIPVTKKLRQISRTDTDALDAAEFIAGAIVKAPLRRGRGIPGAMNRTIKRLGNAADASSFFTTLFRLALGDVPDFQADGLESEHGELTLGQIVERGLGVEAGRTASIGGERPWLAGSDLSELGNISQFRRDIPKLIDRCSKAESKRAKLSGLLDPEDDIDWAERAQVWSEYQPKRRTGRPTYDDLKQPLILSGHGIHLRVEHGALLVQNGLNYFPQTREQWRVFPGDPRMPSRIVIIDADGSITFDALVWLSERNIPLVKLNWRGEVVTLGGHRAVDMNLYEAQLRTRASDGGFKFASTLIQAKLENSLSTLHKLPDCGDRQWAIRGVTRALNDLEKTRLYVPMRQLGLIEARAASAYFRGWKSLEIKWTGTNRRPIPEDWYRLGLRASRVSGTNIDATHPVNAMANYAYGVLESQIKIATVAAGLDPTIGYLHAMQEDRAALVYDLMEPLRPIVDRKLLKFIQSNTFSPFDFTLLTSGVCRLHPQLARTVAAIAIAPESVTSVVQKSASMLLSQQSVRPSPRHSRKVELPGGSAIQTQLHGPAFMEDGVTDNES